MGLTLRETLLAFRRAPLLSALSVMTIAFSLFSLGLFVLVAVNIRDALQQVEERVEIRAYIADGTPVEAIAAALGDIGSFPEVARAEGISQDEALERARAELGEFRDVFDAAFLPASIEVRMKPGFRDPATVSAVAARIRTYPFVDDVRFGEEWVRKLYNIRNIATAAGIILGVAFAAVAIIIIGATIRMAVLARGREISIMRLVGATDGFIRRPFLLEGLAKGILGGLLALGLTYLAHSLISRTLVETRFFDERIILAGIAFGALIGFLGSAVSVGRHLRRV
ncbi:MAG TPA: permease-like cell division protein FtsX [Gemmatimonadaceae bacterium]|nr:permease-like cell division protein FtsX [Gemmatimonadaceae bacterium]